VDGVPLWQAADLAPWEATARWLARLHRREIPAASRLLRHDTVHLRRWLERARAMTPPGALDGVEPAAERAIERLASLPVCLVHGELYPSNVLVQGGPDGPRVRPVDWETLGAGPGVLDLAALVSGDWEPQRRDRVVGAYAGGHPRAGAELARDLDAAGLLVALQWLGWSATWSPPAEHRHDWLAEARAAAGRLAG
jgi:Ser/Thr protein kinase RdoA (MazF antagonist)